MRSKYSTTGNLTFEVSVTDGIPVEVLVSALEFGSEDSAYVVTVEPKTFSTNRIFSVWPNPVRGSANLRFTSSAGKKAHLNIYDVSGVAEPRRLRRSLVDECNDAVGRIHGDNHVVRAVGYVMEEVIRIMGVIGCPVPEFDGPRSGDP